MFETITNNNVDTFAESATMPVVGIRFRNISGVECFISTAINALAANEAVHRTIFGVEGMTDGKEVGTDFSSNQGNEDITGMKNCSKGNGSEGDSGDRNGSNKTNFCEVKVSIVQELKGLFRLNGSIGDTKMVRKILTPFFRVFGEKRQHDAGDALLSILECIPEIQKLFLVSSQYVRTCVFCKNEKREEFTEGFINLDYFNYGGKSIGLQEALNSFQTSKNEMVIECPCNKDMKSSSNSNVAHIETREIRAYP